MNPLNKLIVTALPLMPKILVRQFANKYIAGEEIEDAIRVVKDLNKQGYMATVDVLGEDIHEREASILARDAIIEVLDTISRENLDSNVSIKLTQLGLKLDKYFCLENTRQIVAHAYFNNNFIRIDMEDSSCTSDTIWIYRELRKEFKNLGIALQAYLRRTYDDASSLIQDGLGHFRLCKGIYIEPKEIAYTTRREVNDSFIKILRHMLTRKAYVGIATHDENLVYAAYSLIDELKLSRSEYEFQMLYGVRTELRSKILQDGHRLRVYVPFGKHWYQYSVRRLKENPRIAGYVFKSIFIKDHLN